MTPINATLPSPWSALYIKLLLFFDFRFRFSFSIGVGVFIHPYHNPVIKEASNSALTKGRKKGKEKGENVRDVSVILK